MLFMRYYIFMSTEALSEAIKLPEPFIIGQVPDELIEAAPKNDFNNHPRLLDWRPYHDIGKYMLECAQEAGLQVTMPRQVYATGARLKPGDRGHYRWHHDDMYLLATSWGLNTDVVHGSYTPIELNAAVSELGLKEHETSESSSILELLMNKHGYEPVLKLLPGVKFITLPDKAITLEMPSRHTTHTSPTNLSNNTIVRGFVGVDPRRRFGFMPVKMKQSNRH